MSQTALRLMVAENRRDVCGFCDCIRRIRLAFGERPALACSGGLLIYRCCSNHISRSANVVHASGFGFKSSYREGGSIVLLA